MADQPNDPAALPESIGEAYMEDDGTLVLRLRAEAPTAIGDAVFQFPPDHPRYASMIAHVVEMSPGDSKPVPPWK